ncbi:MAG: hypothetical protein FJ403_02560 [Verrucomicrobia bacterium]|nr:hypothetical protein [Verrucomicrobiota bacterium]
MIAIIAIIASLLLPALSRARGNANSAACRGNLRQIGLALRLYVDDEAEYQFPADGCHLLDRRSVWWLGCLAPILALPGESSTYATPTKRN